MLKFPNALDVKVTDRVIGIGVQNPVEGIKAVGGYRDIMRSRSHPGFCDKQGMIKPSVVSQLDNISRFYPVGRYYGSERTRTLVFR